MPSPNATTLPALAASIAGTSASTSAAVSPVSTPATSAACRKVKNRRSTSLSAVAPADIRVLSSVGRNPSAVSTPSMPNAPR